MWKLLALVLLIGVELSAQDSPQFPNVDPPLFFKFPVGRGDSDICYDSQVHQKHRVGDVWSSPYSGCKQSVCSKEDDVLYIRRYSCPRVATSVDLKKMKANKLMCRELQGDRRKAFPACCPRLYCKHYVNGKLKPAPKHMYPFKY